jgi:TetR/AcrR family transcriptional regulator
MVAVAGGEGESRRQQRRAHHQNVSRTQLLDAAEQLFGQRGYYETTLKEVAELAEFSVGSVYSFFEDKEDLYLHVFLRRGEEFLPAMREAAGGDGSALDQLHRLVDFEVGYFRAHPHFGRLYLRSTRTGMTQSNESPVDDTLGANVESAMAIQTAVFARGQAEGVFRRGDPAVLARLFSGLVAAYQSIDPAVVDADRGAGERLGLADLHEIIDGAFRRVLP